VERAAVLKDQLVWMFESPPLPISEWSAILWWERRRVPFNLFVVGYAIPCFVVFIIALSTSGYLQPGEDAVEPLALLAAPVVINVLYTLGWLVEVPARIVVPSLSPCFGPTLLKLGMGLGVFLISVPAVLWAGYRVLQLVQVVQ
jgi:hypothetical protein